MESDYRVSFGSIEGDRDGEVFKIGICVVMKYGVSVSENIVVDYGRTSRIAQVCLNRCSKSQLEIGI